MKTVITTRVTALFGLLAATMPVWAQLYSVQDLSVLNFYPNAINGYGELVGSVYTTNGSHAALWNGTTVLDLGTLGGTTSYSTAINAAGKVTGSSSIAGDAETHAFVWNGTSMLDLGTLGGSNSVGVAINASGEVTGWSYMPGNSVRHAFFWNGSTMRDLGTLGGTNSEGVAINDKGQVTGSSDVAGNAYSHTFLWSGASMKDLGTVAGATTATPTGMNNAGQVVGNSHNASYSVETGFLWDGTKIVNLNALAGTIFSYATAINAKGQVTGWAQLSTDSRIRSHAYLWKGTTAVRLASDVSSDGGSFGRCSGGESISSSTGLIVGVSCEIAGLNLPFFWNGFAMTDLADLVVPANYELDTGAIPKINNQGQILDGTYLLTPIPGAIGLNIATTATPGCKDVAGYVSSSTPAPPGGLVISVSDTLAAASVPSTVTIPAGAIGATFTISTMPVTSAQSGVITVTRDGRTVSQNLSIRPIGLSGMTLTPNAVRGGNTVAGKVTLECNAAPGSIVVSLSSYNPAIANPVPLTLSIPKGQSSGAFKVTTKHVTARVKVSITGSANGTHISPSLIVNP